MEVSGQLYNPAALPPAPIGWVPNPIWTRWRKEKLPSLLLPVIELRTSSP